MKNLMEAEIQNPKKSYDEIPGINKNLGVDTELSNEVPMWNGNFLK